MGEHWYVDSSALAKLVRTEPETRALKRWLRGKAWLVSDLQRTELRRAARRAGPESLARADALIASADVIRLTPNHFDAAGVLDPPTLRSLDAIHLAAARSLGKDLAGIVAAHPGRKTLA